MRKLINIAAIFMGIMVGSCNVHAAVWIVVYPKSEVDNDVRSEYPVALLELALQKTGVRYELRESTNPLRQNQSVKRLEENLEINVMWSMTDIQREQQLRPVRIPIARGLIGLRVLVTHKDNPFLKAKITKFTDLVEYTPVQGINWPDTKILQANGFNVVTAQDYMEAVSLTENLLADFFPRSIVEAYSELENSFSQNFRVKKGLLLSYPSAQYFFTNKSNLTLSNLIETGLLRAIEDGSYDALFQEHFGEVLKEIDLDKDFKFNLANPLLPQLTPIGKPEFWYYPPVALVQ